MTLSFTSRLLPASIIVSLGALALGLALQGGFVFLPLLVALGAAWLYVRRRRRYSLASALATVALVAVVAGAAMGLMLGAWPVLMSLAVVVALSAWDLTHFERRLRAVQHVERAGEIERHHVRWLSVAAASGFALTAIAGAIHISLSFGAVFAIGLLAALVLSWMIAALRRG